MLARAAAQSERFRQHVFQRPHPGFQQNIDLLEAHQHLGKLGIQPGSLLIIRVSGDESVQVSIDRVPFDQQGIDLVHQLAERLVHCARCAVHVQFHQFILIKLMQLFRLLFDPIHITG